MSKLFLKEFNALELAEPDADESAPEGKPAPQGLLTMKGILQRCNTLNQNGRVYPREVLVRELENYSKLIREDRAFGECDHRDEPIVNMKNVSHMITKIWMEGDVVCGKVRILPTPSGEIIAGIVKGGGRPGISSRALGSLQKEGSVNVVQDDLQIICWDFVSEPSTPGAFMMMSEAKVVGDDVARKIFQRSDRIERIANAILRQKEAKVP